GGDTPPPPPPPLKQGPPPPDEGGGGGTPELLIQTPHGKSLKTRLSSHSREHHARRAPRKSGQAAGDLCWLGRRQGRPRRPAPAVREVTAQNGSRPQRRPAPHRGSRSRARSGGGCDSPGDERGRVRTCRSRALSPRRGRAALDRTA